MAPKSILWYFASIILSTFTSTSNGNTSGQELKESFLKKSYKYRRFIEMGWYHLSDGMIPSFTYVQIHEMIGGFSRHHDGGSKVASWVKGNVFLEQPGMNLSMKCKHKKNVWCKSYRSLGWEVWVEVKNIATGITDSACHPLVNRGFYGNGNQLISRMSLKFPCPVKSTGS